jgi:hypothetical protein
MKTETIESMFEGSIRAEVIIHLATMLAQDSFPGIATEAFMEEDPEPLWESIGIEPPYDLDDPGLIFDHLMDNDKSGFLVKFATPVPQNIKDGSHSMSWGYYATHWIYADTYQEACEKALAWRQEFYKKRKKFLEDQLIANNNRVDVELKEVQ